MTTSNDLPLSWPSHIPLKNNLQSSPSHTFLSPPPPSSLPNKSISFPINSLVSPMGYCPKYTSQTTPSKIHLQHDTSLHNRLLKLATPNIQSVRNKTDIIIDLMHGLDIDILCITETWLSDNYIPILFNLNTKSLRFTHLPRPEPNYGGGIGVLYKNNIKLIHSSDLHLDHSEAFKCTFHPVNSLNFTLITIYRPPHNSTLFFIHEIDKIMSSLTNQTILHTLIFHYPPPLYIQNDFCIRLTLITVPNMSIHPLIHPEISLT